MQDLSFSKTLNPFPFPFFHKLNSQISRQFPPFPRLDICALAGRSKKKPGGQSSGRLEGSFRRRSKGKPKYRPVNLEDYPFYRFKNTNKKTLYADNFTESELEMIGLGYDRMVRFMEKDDPDLRHPHDWYKYGEYGPYSWRGVVVGEPVRGRFSDERVAMYSPVKNHEEWEQIEQHEMAVDFGKRLEKMDKSVGFRYFWVFVRHPRWRIDEKPWQQWTLVAEVVVEAGKDKRLDKWNLMGRFGNKARSLITQCAAWMRPDIIYVKRPVYQCRFEPQDGFFKGIVPFLDPKTERSFLFELRNDDGSVELCTYYGGLCKIARVSPKSFVDDVVNAYEKLSEENKSKCLEFLLSNHPGQLLHPYTKEWKLKLEEEELGCDAPDDDEDDHGSNGETEFTEWIEDDSDGSNDAEFVDENDDMVMDMDEGDDELGVQGEDDGDVDGKGDGEGDDDDDEEEFDPEEDEKFWEEEFKKAASSSERMELLAKRSVEASSKLYKKQLMTRESKETENVPEDGDETAIRGKRAKVSPEEWKMAGFGPWRRRVKKSKIPPQLFLRAAVRPFTYRNLVKEIVLIRHAILDGDIGIKE